MRGFSPAIFRGYRLKNHLPAFFNREFAPAEAGRKVSMKKKRRSGFIIACTAPAVILFVIFMIIPTIDVFRMSLYKWGGYTAEKTFVGFENFKKLSQNPKFYQAFQNSVLLIVIVTLVTFCLSLVFASILSREKIKGQNFFRIVFYIPNILLQSYSLCILHFVFSIHLVFVSLSI